MIFLNKCLLAILASVSLVSATNPDEKSPLTWKKAEQKVETLSRVSYPNWIETFTDQGVESVTIFSYGSLMDYSSAKATLNEETLKSIQPALAFGVTRLFDRDVPIRKGSKWKSPCSSLARGMLNVKPASSSQFINGILMEVPIDELEQLMQREEGYDLIPVVVSKWDDQIEGRAHYFVAYTFHAPQKSAYTNNEILPRPNYYELSRDAAATISPAFKHLWMQTTYLADGRPIAEWELNDNSSRSVYDP